MRIVLVTETFFPAVDGTTTTVKAVLDRLIDRGHEVLVIAPGPGLSSYRGCRIARVRPLERRAVQIRAALDAFRPDLLHVVSPAGLGRRALDHAKRLGVPSVVVEQSGDPAEVETDRLLTTSSWMTARLEERGARLWRPGVDTAAFTPDLRDEWLHGRWSKRRSRATPLVVVGYVGSLRNRHDVRRLADLARVPGIRPVVVGDGPQRSWLESRLPGAKFLGPLTTGELTAVLPSVDILVHPGRSETCCHVHREAAAAGVPVVAPRSGGATDVVRHLETGLLHDPADERGLVRTVTALAADRHRALLGARGRELSVRTWVKAADELVDEHYVPLLDGTATRTEPAGNRA